MEILSKLIGSQNRVKLLRIFLFNTEKMFEVKEMAKRAKISAPKVRKELAVFRAVKLIRPKSEVRGVGKKKKRVQGWQLNPAFPFIPQFRELLTLELFPEQAAIAKKFRHCGKLKLLAISGIFLHEEHSQVDLVLVGDNLRRHQIENTVKGMEAEIGKDLTYAVLETNDFIYRLHSSDKFVRDLLDYPHELLVDKIGL